MQLFRLRLGMKLGWEPTTLFDEGIKKTVKWYLENRPWWENIISGEYQNYYEKMYGGKYIIGITAKLINIV